MKTVLISIFTLACLGTQAQNLRFPDNNLKEALLSNGVDTNGDGEIQTAEAKKVTKLYIDHANISDLTGIKNFTSLEEFGFYDNKIRVIDFSGMTSLKSIYGFNNQIERFNVKGCTKLQDIYLSFNKIRMADVNGLPALKDLRLDNNAIANAAFSDIATLEVLELQRNKMSTLKLENLPNLRRLNLTENYYSTLDFTPFKKLEEIWLMDNEFLKSLQIRGLRALKELHLESCPQLVNLNLSGTVSLRKFDWY